MDFRWLWFVNVGSSMVTNVPLRWGMLITLGAYVWGQGICGKFLHFPSILLWTLNCSENIKSIKKKKTTINKGKRQLLSPASIPITNSLKSPSSPLSTSISAELQHRRYMSIKAVRSYLCSATQSVNTPLCPHTDIYKSGSLFVITVCHSSCKNINSYCFNYSIT